MTEIIAAALAILAALAGAFVGQLWGRMRGEHDGRASALQDMERAQRKSYRETRERIDNAPRATDAADARQRLLDRQSRREQ